MKKKKIRYSELGSTPPPQATTAPAEAPAPAPASTPALPVVAASVDVTDELPTLAELPLDVTREHAVEALPAPLPPSPPKPDVLPQRRPRVSTPVELARALAAEKAAAEEAAAAQLPPKPAVKEELVDLLMFRVGAERFAVELLAVDEVIDLPVIHFVPEMPPFMVGVVNVRGALTPVYSPHVPLGLPLAQSEALLIFRHAGARVGILIDDVEDAINVDLRELRETPGTHEHDEVVLGVVRHDGVLVAVADIQALIAACQSAAVLETA